MLKNQIPVASVINVYWEIKLSIYCRKTQLYRYQARESEPCRYHAVSNHKHQVIHVLVHCKWYTCILTKI